MYAQLASSFLFEYLMMILKWFCWKVGKGLKRLGVGLSEFFETVSGEEFFCLKSCNFKHHFNISKCVTMLKIILCEAGGKEPRERKALGAQN